MINRITGLLRAIKPFKCRRCPTCCSLIVRLSDEDIELLENAGRKGFIDNRPDWTKMLPTDPLYTKPNFLKMKDGKCIFFEIKEDKGFCTVQDSKPKECRDFPYKKWLGLKIIIDKRCRA